MKLVFLIGGGEVAFLLAQGLAKLDAKAVFVANDLNQKVLATLGTSLELETLPRQLQLNPNSALMILTPDIPFALLQQYAQIAKEQAITMLPSLSTWQRLQQPLLLQLLGCKFEPYLSADELCPAAQYLPYPLLVQGPVLDANNFYQVLRRPKQLSWALDNAKALAVTKFRLSCYQEVKRSFLMVASYQAGLLQTPTVIGLNNEHGVLHEAWQGELLPDHCFIKASAKLAQLAFGLAQEGVISAYFDVVNEGVVLRSFAPWPVLASWVSHKEHDNVFQQQLQLLLQKPLLPGANAGAKSAAALKLQSVSGPAKPDALLQYDFQQRLLFYKQGQDVRETLRALIIAANHACQ